MPLLYRTIAVFIGDFDLRQGSAMNRVVPKGTLICIGINPDTMKVTGLTCKAPREVLGPVTVGLLALEEQLVLPSTVARNKHTSKASDMSSSSSGTSDSMSIYSSTPCRTNKSYRAPDPAVTTLSPSKRTRKANDSGCEGTSMDTSIGDISMGSPAVARGRAVF